MHTKQNGFGVIAIVVVLLAVGIIGFGGWYVWNMQKPATTSTGTIPAGYKEYRNGELSFVYPADWTQQGSSVLQYYSKGTFAAFVSPQTDKVYKDFLATGRATEGPAASDLVVSKWNSINDTEAKGGDSATDRTYSSLKDFLYDAKNTEKIKQLVGTLDVHGVTVYEVSVGGAGENYGVMIEHNGSIYELDFPAITNKQEVTPQATRIVQSLTFSS